MWMCVSAYSLYVRTYLNCIAGLLEKFNASKNILEALPNTLDQLVSLQALNVSDNKLSALFTGIGILSEHFRLSNVRDVCE